MKTTALAAGIVAALLAAAGAASLAVVTQQGRPGPDGHAHEGAGADLHALHGGTAGDDPHAQLGMERPAFPPAAGSVPTAEEARNLKQVSGISVSADSEFDAGHGVSGGAGTLDDPYRITGLDVTGDLYVADTSLCFEVAGNWIDGQLVLNWNGPCVFVHHNFVRDLRVNENVPRTGLATGGLIELNQVNYVGQIRHYDGEFRHNVVGPRQDDLLPFGVFDDPENLLPFLKDTRVLNIDGWNQALFHHNTVDGSVDLKLHGHHHGTGFLARHSHYHGDGKAPHAEDHADRWSSVAFTDNAITDPEGYGLRYTDELHAGDDRTAQSESTEELEKAHRHHTLAEIARNTLEGAGIWVDVFNADDERHRERNPGWLAIDGNAVHLAERHPGLLGTQWFGPRYQPNTAIWVWQSKEAQVAITGNTVAFQETRSNDPLQPANDLAGRWFGPGTVPVAIAIEGASDADYTVSGNQATGFAVGAKGSFMDEDVQWAVFGNDWGGAADAVSYDDSVANPPHEEPLAPGPGPYDDAPAGEPHGH